MSRFLRHVTIFIAIVGGLLGLTLSLLIVNTIFGGWGVLLGLFLFPLTWAYFPFYTLFVYGNWNLLLITYGSIAASWYLLRITDKLEMAAQVPGKEPPTKPVVTQDYPAPAVMLLISGIILIAVLFARSNSAFAPISLRTLKPGVLETKIPLPRSTPTQTFLSLRGCVTDSTIRIRRGPGTQYEVIGGMVSGTCMWLLGRNQESNWVYMVTEDNKIGWVAAWLLTIYGDVSRLSVRAVPEGLRVTPTATPRRGG